MEKEKLLLKYDKPGEFEYPADFSYDGYLARFYHFAAVLCENKIRFYKTDTTTQDASFIAQIIIRQRHTDEGIYQAVIRFSNFGRLVSICENTNELPEKELIISLLEKEGFEFIPYDILDRKYDGINKDNVFGSWFIKYFDYI